MQDRRLWELVEAAACDLEKPGALLEVYTSNYLEVPVETFALTARVQKESMEILSNLAYELTLRARQTLEQALEEAYAQERREAQA